MAARIAAQSAKPSKKTEFRVGRVKAFLRGRVWYLCYHEQGRSRRPRVGDDREAARQLAAQINGQLETGTRAALSFDSVTVPDLREQWIQYHESVKRSSLQTVNRYRTASQHLLRFLKQHPVRSAAHFNLEHAEEFVRYLRQLRVAPNGHPNTPKRPLLDKGIQFILETCRALFTFAAKRRYLPPYAENPFVALELGRMPLEVRRPIVLPAHSEVARVISSSSTWEFPVFLTLTLCGMRPGELCHLLIEDFDPSTGVLFIHNRPEIGWQVKTRRDRVIPLVPPLTEVLRRHVGDRDRGTLFLRPKRDWTQLPAWTASGRMAVQEFQRQQLAQEQSLGRGLSRREWSTAARRVWTEMGLVKPDYIRKCLIRCARHSGILDLATPKIFRHLFATVLQEGRVDPLIRNELLGHIAEEGPRCGAGLGMTANYTHTRMDTRRTQLIEAFATHPLLPAARQRLTLSAAQGPDIPADEMDETQAVLPPARP